MDLERNDAKGNKGMDSNVQDTLNNLRKLSRIQGCPTFAANEDSLMATVITQAQQARRTKALQTPRDHSKSAQNRQTLTSKDIDGIFAVCAQSPRLPDARAQVLTQLELQTGFRGCEVIHAKWFDMQLQTADQLNHIGPDESKVIGIGINQGKTYVTGEVKWTGFAQHAYAHYDLAASLGELLSCEICDNCKLVDKMLARDEWWDEISILFPGHRQDP